MVFKTISFNSKQLSVPSIEAIPISNEVVKHLSEVVQITTTSHEAMIDTTAFLAFQNYLDSNFLLIDSLLEKSIVNDFSIVYRWPGKNPRLDPILLLGHIDVVPVEKESWNAWTHPPYSGVVSDGFVWGRGTLDDKVSILGILEAIEILLKEDYQPQRTVYLACGHDEEISGFNGAQAIARMFKQQGLNFEYVIDEGMVLIEDALPGLSKPVALIGTAEKGYTTLKLTAKLPNGGHSSMPPAETVIGILSEAILKLQNNPFPSKIEGPIESLFDYTGPEMSFPMKTVFANRWLTEGLLKWQLSGANTTNALIRTTVAPTILRSGVKDNVLPTEATVTINFRIAPNETTQSVMEYVQNTISDDRITVSKGGAKFSSEPSPISDMDSFGYRVIEKTAHEIFSDIIVAPTLVLAATDSRHYIEVSKNIYRFIPLKMMQENTKRIHGIDERVGIEDYKNAIRFYHQLLKNSCK
jgi:carboxypeptidase PM20D1